MMPRSVLFPRAAFLMIAVLLSMLPAHAAPMKFDIPAQSAPAALRLFIKQSGTQVMFVTDEVKAVRTNAVVGDFEPGAALDALLAGTGFAADQRKTGWFTVVRSARKEAGSVKGVLIGEYGKPLAEVLVAVRETAQSVTTGKGGEYFFPVVAAGNYTLVATAAGYQPLHITDVIVRAGRDLTLGREQMQKPLGDTMALEPFIVRADAVTELDKFEVTGVKQKPFIDGNADIPRTIDDAQPYYVFNGADLATSGVGSVDEFLRRRLTMNLQASTNVQNSIGSSQGNTSLVNLRGLGTNRTLILVNGRRQTSTPGVGGVSQADVNNISLGEIERIEVLPSSASGIYGGSALGGVVNVILRKDYAGGELNARYDNPFDTDAPSWTVGARYGGRFDGGKGRFKLGFSRSGGSSMLLQDRVEIWQRGMDTVQKNDPTFITSAVSPWLGSLTNITPSAATVASLTLDNGVSLGSRNTFVPAGTSLSTPLSTLYAGLLANAGKWNLDAPPITQGPTGLKQQIYSQPSVRTFSGGASWELNPRIEFFADFSYRINNAVLESMPVASSVVVSAASPINPFTTAVRVTVPLAYTTETFNNTTVRSLVTGALLHLPGGWEGNVDYSRSDSRLESRSVLSDTTAITAALNAGTYNPFVDTLMFAPDVARFLSDIRGRAVTTNDEFTARAAGALPALPWGEPRLTTSVAYRSEGTPETTRVQVSPTATASNTRTYFPGEQTIAQGYAEVEVPLVAANRFPGIDSLTAQLGARAERFEVDTGTVYSSFFPATGATTYNGPTLNGQPYFSKARYESTNHVLALKYQPVKELILRASTSTAFTPPTSTSLVKNPTITNSVINDPRNGGASYTVPTETGGNPDTTPEDAKSKDFGLIWQPKRWGLDGLRLGVQWQKTEIFNQITTLSAQNILNAESALPDRVQRDASGFITLIDASAVNLFRTETESWDFSLDYGFKTSLGTFDTRASVTYTPHRLVQFSLTSPSYEGAGYHSMELFGGTKTRGAFELKWRRAGWEAGWSATYWGNTKVYGAAGGPFSLQTFGGAEYSYYILAQGSSTTSSLLLHDAYVGYTFPRKSSGTGGTGLLARVGAVLLSDTTLQAGVNNLANTFPPMDANNASLNYFASYYGDMRLRTYWVQLRKAF